jgi:cell surface protein SprA
VSYYEVSTVLTENDPRRRTGGWIDFRLPISELSRTKIGFGAVLPDSFIAGPGDGSDGNPPRTDLGDGLRATVRGSPSFSRVWRISVGLRNISGRELSRGSVWFDELRMGEVRKDRGWASQGSINLQLADLASLGASVSMTSADFLLLGQNRGSGTENLRYDLRGEIGLHKFMEPLNIRAPLSASLNRTRQTPKFRPNSDILYDGRDSGRDVSETVSRLASLAVSRTTRNHQNWLPYYTIDAVALNGNASQILQDRVTSADSTFQKSGSVAYRFDAAHWKPLRLLRVNLFPWPRSIQANVSGGRTERRVWTPDAGNTLRLTNRTVTRSGVLRLGATVQPIQSLNYNWGSERDLIDEHFGPDSSVVRRDRPVGRLLGINVGRETAQTHALSFSYTPPFLGRSFQPRFSWNSGSTQNMAPSITLENYERAAFNIDNNNSASLALTLPVNDWINSLLGVRQARSGGASPVRRPAAADSAKGDDKPNGKSVGGQFRTLFTQIIQLKPVQGSGQITRTSSFPNLSGTPPLLYRLGLSRNVGLGTSVETVENASFNAYDGRTVTVRGNTSVVLLKEVTMDLNYQRRQGTSQTGNAQARLDKEITWPEIRFNWGEIQKKIPLLNKVLSDFKVVNTSYSRQTRETGRSDNPRETVTVTTNWRPLFSIQGTLGGWKTNLTTNRSSSENTSDRLGSASVTGRQRSNNVTLGFDRKLRRVDVKLDLSYTSTSSEVVSSSRILKGDARQTIRINTSAGVRLSSKMTGTFGLELGQERQPTRDYTRRNVRVYFSTGFSF